MEGKMLKQLTFKYHKDPIRSNVFKEETTICDCCGKETPLYYCGPIYGNFDEDPKFCPDCIKNGIANQWAIDQGDKFGCQFFEDAENVSDKEKIKELLERTPGHFTYQPLAWPSHCDDFCQFIS